MLYKLIRPASIVSMVLDLYCCCIYFCNVGICEIITLRRLWWCVLPKSGRWGNDALFQWRSTSFNIYRCSHPIKWSYIYENCQTMTNDCNVFAIRCFPRRVYAHQTKGYGHTYTTRWININRNRNYLEKKYLNQTMQLPEYRKVSSSISITLARGMRGDCERLCGESLRGRAKEIFRVTSFGYESRKNVSLVTTHNNLQNKIGIPYPYIE